MRERAVGLAVNGEGAVAGIAFREGNARAASVCVHVAVGASWGEGGGVRVRVRVGTRWGEEHKIGVRRRAQRRGRVAAMASARRMTTVSSSWEW